MNPPTLADIQNAAQLIKGLAVRTPLLESPMLSEQLGMRLFVKAECLQRTGSFKFRGAYTMMSRLTADERKNGVVTYSSGNHAQGVAASAALFGIPATIIMPEDAPEIKINNTRALGAEVILYDRYTGNREEIGDKLCAKTGAVLVKPYDDRDLMSGQGTVGLEIVEDLQALGLSADIVITPCGGGGLTSGTALAVHGSMPAAKIYSAEPENFDDTARSLACGERVSNEAGHKTLCDAIATPMPGELTFSVNSKELTGGLVLNEDEVLSAMAEAFRSFKIVVEPGGVVALAAALTGKVNCKGKIVVAVCSGGNVDPAVFARALEDREL